MKKSIVLVFIILTLVLAACATKAANPLTARDLRQSGGAPGVTVQEVAPPALPTMAPAYEANKAVDAAAGGSGGENLPVHNRMIVKNADLTIVVANPQTKMEAISGMASSMGGWVVSMNMYQTYTQNGKTAPEGSISIRVPAVKLDAALSQIKAGVVEVRNETHSGQDVTSQYTDLQSQLNNLEMAEKDLQAIMEEAKNNPNSNTTSKTQDVLSVYNQIVSVRGQIEQIKGQMKYFEESSDTSLINVTLIAEETIKPLEIGGWKPEGKVRDAIQKLINFLEGFVDFLIYLALLVIPILIVIFGPLALVAWGIVALVRRSKARKAKQAK